MCTHISCSVARRAILVADFDAEARLALAFRQYNDTVCAKLYLPGREGPRFATLDCSFIVAAGAAGSVSPTIVGATFGISYTYIHFRAQLQVRRGDGFIVGSFLLMLIEDRAINCMYLL
jgi:hypothetical protein